MAKKALYRVLTSYQDNFMSHDKGAIVEIDEDKIAPGENLKKLSDADIKTVRRKAALAEADANGELLAEDEAA